MNRFLKAAALVTITTLLSAAAAAPPDASPASKELGFLEVGKDYVIRFPEASNIFKTTQAAVTQSTYTTADGQKQDGGPVTWNYTLSVTIFQVVRMSGGSWVLLRHPTNPDDFMRWGDQRRATAILAGPHAETIGAKPDGQQRLKKLREAAKTVIPTSETWVNLNHAIAIAPVPTDEVEPKLTIQSIKVHPKD